MEAIESIRSLERGGHKVSVIVVDNASPNGTGEQVKKQIESLPDFYYIHNEKISDSQGATMSALNMQRMN
jgi:Glycosyl transferase family 2.